VQKAISIPYSECVSVASVIQHAKAQAPYYIVICGPSGYHIFPHFLINGTIFGKNVY